MSSRGGDGCVFYFCLQMSFFWGPIFFIEVLYVLHGTLFAYEIIYFGLKYGKFMKFFRKIVAHC